MVPIPILKLAQDVGRHMKNRALRLTSLLDTSPGPWPSTDEFTRNDAFNSSRLSVSAQGCRKSADGQRQDKHLGPASSTWHSRTKLGSAASRSQLQIVSIPHQMQLLLWSIDPKDYLILSLGRKPKSSTYSMWIFKKTLLGHVKSCRGHKFLAK
jgi:hypothetical protein